MFQQSSRLQLRLSAEQVIVSAPSSAKEAPVEEQGAEQAPTERRAAAEESPQEPSRPSSRVSNEASPVKAQKTRSSEGSICSAQTFLSLP